MADYREIERGRIRVFSTVIVVDGKPKRVWHWQRFAMNGTQVDGSGPQRNGLETKAQIKALVKERFPDDRVEGL